MPAPIRQIHRYLERLGRRERLILAVRGASLALAVALVALVLGGFAVSLGAGRLPLQVLVFGAGAPLALAVLALPLWRALRRAAPLLHQARRVEHVAPVLRGRLLTAVDAQALLREEGGKPAPAGVSRVLLARAAARAAVVIEDLPPAAVHPARPAARAAATLAGASLLALLAGWLLPVGPVDALGVAFGRSAAEARLESAAALVSPERAVVGDIVLRYVFPEYTGIEAIEIPNSDGTIHAPPGTKVIITARTEETFQAAALQVDDQPPQDALLSQGRNLGGSLVVEADGVYRFLLFRGNSVVASPDYRIVAEADAPPVVALDRPPDGAVPVDQPLGFGWSVKDDYGIGRVVLEVRKAGSDEVAEFELRAPLDQPTDLRGGVRKTPRELGLAPGDQAELRVVAYDNDLLGGSKRGSSPEMNIQVVGPRGGGARLAAYTRRLRDALIPVLADFLEERVPPSSTAAGMTAWVGTARARLEPVQEIVDAQWGGEDATSIDAKLVHDVLETAGRLFRFTLTTYDPSTVRRVTDGDVETFAALDAEEVDALEKAVYLLDMMLRQAALAELAEQAAQVAQEAQELAQLAENGDAAELLARLDQLERLMAELARTATQLSEGSLQEFVNARIDETRNLMDQIRQAIAEGRLDDARQMLQQLAEQLQQMSEQVGDQFAQSQQGESEVAEQYEQLVKDLEQLEQDQRALAEEVAKARDELGDDLSQQLDLWNRLDALAQQGLAASLRAVDASGTGQGWRVDSIRRLERAHENMAGVRDAIRARDPEAALREVIGATLPLDMALRAAASEAVRARPAGQEPAEGVQEARRGAEEAVRIAREIRSLLEQLAQEPRSSNPALEKAAQDLSRQQQQLRDRAEELTPQVQQLELQMPTSDGSASQAMQRAGESMGRAEQSLGQGDPLPAEGHQRDAANQVGSARQQLQQQMQQMQQMQQQVQRMQQQGEGQGPSGRDRDDGQEQDAADRVEIPAPEEFQTPEEYRRALLEGMQADVPDEFQALKKRYYEELVRQ